MKKTESNNLEAKKPIQVRLNPKDGHSSIDNGQKQDLEKTRVNKIGEEAEIDPNDKEIFKKSDISFEIDEIIQNNDKFETVKVIMEILCKELEIPKDSQFPVIAKALNGVWEQYWKSMEEWRNLVKMGKKDDIRQ